MKINNKQHILGTRNGAEQRAQEACHRWSRQRCPECPVRGRPRRRSPGADPPPPRPLPRQRAHQWYLFLFRWKYRMPTCGAGNEGEGEPGHIKGDGRVPAPPSCAPGPGELWRKPGLRRWCHQFAAAGMLWRNERS